MTKHITTCLIILILNLVSAGFAAAQVENICDCSPVKSCEENPFMLQNTRRKLVEMGLSDAEMLKTMWCLLKLRGKKTPVWGVTSNAVSQSFGPSPVEVVALFQISALFYGNNDFANAMVLVDKHDKYNTDQSIAKAYRAFGTWLRMADRNGVAEMRKRKQDPLRGSGIRWF